MSETIRSVHRDEREALMRFLERCYGAGRGAWERWQPEWFSPESDPRDYQLVIDRDGEIVSHVGGYPLEMVMGPARTVVAGVGNVGTHPDERGKGYMGQLLEESIRRWREWGWTLSALWGDRQRYGAFGWERCGRKYAVHLSRRSLKRSGIEPVDIGEVDRRDPQAIARVSELHGTLPYRVERPNPGLTLRREGTRLFLGPDGYLLSSGDYGDLRVSEIASPTDRAPELILGTMNWASTGGANVTVCPGDIPRLKRVVDAMAGWSLEAQGTFRIIDWPALLTDLRPLLEEKAQGLSAFSQSIGCRWRDGVEWATAEWDGEELSVAPGKTAEGVEVGLPRLTALVCGGPLAGAERLGPLSRLLPVSVHVPSLDHV